MPSFTASTLLAVLGIAAGLSSRVVAQSDASVTTNQASAAGYGKHCASCHGAGLEGSQFGPPLKGAPFEARWRSQSPAEFAEYVRTRMPPAGPGNLGANTYAQIEAYVRERGG